MIGNGKLIAILVIALIVGFVQAKPNRFYHSMMAASTGDTTFDSSRQLEKELLPSSELNQNNNNYQYRRPAKITGNSWATVPLNGPHKLV